jgi:hypothetical protein
MEKEKTKEKEKEQQAAAEEEEVLKQAELNALAEVKNTDIANIPSPPAHPLLHCFLSCAPPSGSSTSNSSSSSGAAAPMLSGGAKYVPASVLVA